MLLCLSNNRYYLSNAAFADHGVALIVQKYARKATYVNHEKVQGINEYRIRHKDDMIWNKKQRLFLEYLFTRDKKVSNYYREQRRSTPPCTKHHENQIDVVFLA